jgi:hypothetical protein
MGTRSRVTKTIDPIQIVGIRSHLLWDCSYQLLNGMIGMVATIGRDAARDGKAKGYLLTSFLTPGATNPRPGVSLPSCPGRVSVRALTDPRGSG